MSTTDSLQDLQKCLKGADPQDVQYFAECITAAGKGNPESIAMVLAWNKHQVRGYFQETMEARRHGESMLLHVVPFSLPSPPAQVRSTLADRKEDTDSSYWLG